MRQDQFEDRRKQSLTGRMKKLREELERHEFTDSLSDFIEPNGGVNNTIVNLHKFLLHEKRNNSLSVMCKIFIGKHYLLSVCDNDKSYFYSLLKQNHINYSRTEVSFVMKLGKLADKFPTLCWVSVSLVL